MLIWQANSEVHKLVETIKIKNHLPRLQEAKVAVCFNDAKAFIGDRFNWGKVAKFSPMAKIFQPEDRRYDFCVTIASDAWVAVLDEKQREALLDLHLERCQVEYVPVMIEENGKKIPVKDEWGRIQYTDQIKMDEDGIPKWKIVPLDLNVFQQNVWRYGCWCYDLADFKTAINKN